MPAHCIFLFGISGGEILIIMLVVLLLFGPSKIPEIARLLGRGINEVKKVQREINTEIHRYSAEVEREASKIQKDINELKQEISKTVKEDSPKPKEPAEKTPQQPQAYTYDQYGLDDDYSKYYAQGSIPGSTAVSEGGKRVTSVGEKSESSLGEPTDSKADQAGVPVKKTTRKKAPGKQANAGKKKGANKVEPQKRDDSTGKSASNTSEEAAESNNL